MSIKNIIQSETNLNSTRSNQIKTLVRHIAANNSIHAQRVAALSQQKIIFCVGDNRITDLGQFNIQNDINERFKTRNPKFKASYYEIWDKIPSSRTDYSLNRIYFHLYSVENREDKEYILLHTDPKDTDLTHGNYKRSPHLHIKQSCDDIIPHAHFALNINDYDLALSSLEEINKCFQNHIKMLAHQILKI
ncbi:hypothetical protein [Flavobacterium soli]|uniref:hypothetical protein n=1 Tax=Flavobacterium soli TaxID=344881 RepID=UPI00041E8720|nr:hypothetical protein [Flavobacterium soli]